MSAFYFLAVVILSLLLGAATVVAVSTFVREWRLTRDPWPEVEAWEKRQAALGDRCYSETPLFDATCESQARREAARVDEEWQRVAGRWQA